MEIISNTNKVFNQYENKCGSAKQKPKLQPNFCSNPVGLPSVDTVGQSIVNTSVPVQYKLIAKVPVPGVETPANIYKLANGQTVAILPKKGPSYIDTYFNVGSLNETPDIKGISHFIEHNLFNGSKDLKPGEYDSTISIMGGSTNACTDTGYTRYYSEIQLLEDDSLERQIKLNAQLTQAPTFPVDYLENEKGAVKSEIDMYADDEKCTLNDTCFKNLFGIKEEFNDTLGTKEHIDSFTREKVSDYYNTWYTPDNTITFLVGDFDPDEAISLVSKYFNKKPDYSKVNQRKYPELKPIEKTIREDFISKNETTASLNMGFALPDNLTFSEINKLKSILSMLSCENSTLAKKLDELGASAKMIVADVENTPTGKKGISIYGECNEQDIEKVINIIYQELWFYMSNPFPSNNLQNYKNMYAERNKDYSEESGNILADDFINMIRTGQYNYYQTRLNDVLTLNENEIPQLLQKSIDLNKASIAVLHSKDANETNIRSNYNQASNISFTGNVNKRTQQRLAEDINNIENYRLPNNITLNTIPTKKTSTSLSFIFEHPKIEMQNTAAFDVLNEILNSGTAFKDKNAYREYKDKTGIINIVAVDREGMMVISNFEDYKTQDAFDLIKELLSNPNFSQKEFDEIKAKKKKALEASEEDIKDKINRRLYADEIEYQKTKEEKLKDLESLTLDDVKQLYAQIMQTSSLDVFLTGNTKEKPHLKDIAVQNLSTMPQFKTYQKTNNWRNQKFYPINEPIVVTNAKDVKKATITSTYTYVPSENIDDIARIEAMNFILGGASMSSRLFSDLRTDKGLVYGAGSYIDKNQNTGYITLGTNITTDDINDKNSSSQNVQIALDSFSKNVERLKTEPITDEELEMTKNILRTQLLNSLSNSMDKTAGYMRMYDTPYGKNYNLELFNAFGRLTKKDIMIAANYVFKNPPLVGIEASQKTLDECSQFLHKAA